MNKLIIIGNGFDLAHRMKTSYIDFIKYYLANAFKSSSENQLYQDELIKIVSVKNYQPYEFELFNGFDEMIDLFYRNGRIMDLLNNRSFKVKDTSEYYYDFPIEVTINSDFLKFLLLKLNETRWVDVEQEYYRILKSILLTNREEKEKQKDLNKLNRDLNDIANHLKRYLKTIKKPYKISEIEGLIYEPINTNDIIESTPVYSTSINNILVLNFNFTNTINSYFSTPIDPKFNIKVVNIHGELDDPKNPPIFGFGDELDIHFDEIERSTLSGILMHSKSLAYLRTDSYHRLIEFIEKGDYQTYIWGHSCGLSDRTLLNTIFEHDRCRSIKIYYHKTGDSMDNFNQIIEDLSRNFKNKIKMRNRVLNKTRCTPMPQVS